MSLSVGSALAASVCKKITGRLTSAIAKQEDVSVQLEALDIMADMLCRYTLTHNLKSYGWFGPFSIFFIFCSEKHGAACVCRAPSLAAVVADE